MSPLQAAIERHVYSHVLVSSASITTVMAPFHAAIARPCLQSRPGFKVVHQYSHVPISSSYRASMSTVTSSFQDRPLLLQLCPQFGQLYGVYDYNHVLVLRASMSTVMSPFHAAIGRPCLQSRPRFKVVHHYSHVPTSSSYKESMTTVPSSF